ncbi:uncharacterized protein LOC116007232 [Ipomoea triloba]|uniref:uncharacterized protein LOC116007232 n=1 Tax=Ipomoea triloba TaxID=35885 RepID=UPI00125D9C55|nr:uncharacterized protein LOC116007232 [Ipomoea triloba]
MKCISTPRLAVSWNGRTSDWFQPERGIRQGGPISSLLFLLCIERISYIILDSVNIDDMVLFGEATIEQADEMLRYLRVFCDHSGQMANVQKSSLFFSKNTDAELQQKIVDLIGIPRVEDLGKYLGIPSIHGRLKKDSYAALIERVQQRLYLPNS